MGDAQQGMLRAMEHMWDELHNGRLGGIARIDIIPPEYTYASIVKDQYRGGDFEQFLESSFYPFCVGYLDSDSEKVISQNYPIAWGITKNRYVFYQDIGRDILRRERLVETNLDGYLYETFDSGSLGRREAVVHGARRFGEIRRQSKSVLADSVHSFFFDDSIAFCGVELVMRVVVSCPWEKSSPMRGEFQRHLQHVIDTQGNMVSVRLVARNQLPELVGRDT